MREDMLKEIDGFELPGNKDKAPGTATVYITRPSGTGSYVRFDVFPENARIDSLEAGYNNGNQHIWFSINPGKHRLLSVAENTAEIEKDFKADSTYFFNQDALPGFIMPRNALRETDSVEGKFNVKNTSEGTMLRNKLNVSDDMRSGGEPMDPRGVEFLADFKFGGMTGGLQSRSGLVSDKGDNASIGKTGFGLALRYYFLANLGVSAETGGLWGNATAPGTKAMSYIREWSTNAGLVLVPFNQSLNSGFIRYAVSGGLNYTRLAFSDEYITFTETHSDFHFYDDAGSGFGWYAGPEIEVVLKRGLIVHFGGRFYQEDPKFPKGTRAYTGNQFLGSVGLGYRF